MKYETIREITPEILIARSEDGREVFLDKVSFAIMPKDSVRFEIQTEIQKRIDQTRNIHVDGLLKYSAFVKHADEMYLVRKKDGGVWREFKPAQLGDACRALLTLLHVIRAFHEQDIPVGGLSRGMVKLSETGTVIIQEPWVFNYLNKWLIDENYRFEMAPETIRGGAWNTKSDIFSWGVLAYQFITGQYPFFAERDSDRIAQILRGKVAPPKDYCPRLSQELNDLIIRALNVQPSVRPELDELISLLEDQISKGTYEVPEAEARQYAVRAESKRKQHQVKEKTWLWFRRYGYWVSAVLICLAVLIGMTLGFRPKSVITSKTSPRSVINYYFQGVRQVNVSLMMETLHHAKNSLDNMVSSVHVMNVQRIAFSRDAKKIQIKVNPVKITLLSQSEKEIQYKVNYAYDVIFPDGKVEQSKREDIFTLKPVHKVWKITHIKILKEQNFQRRIEEPNQEKTTDVK